MKNRLFILFTILFCSSIQHLYAQNEIKSDYKYHTWVTTFNNSQSEKGHLKVINDSLITLLNPSLKLEETFQVKNVKGLSFRRKGNVGLGVVIGATLGMMVGGGIGGVLKKAPESGLGGIIHTINILYYAIPGIAIGGLIGGSVGSIQVKIPINGSVKNNKDVWKYY